MSLRTRLTAAFVAIVALPLVLAAIVLCTTVPHTIDDRTRDQVSAARLTAAATVNGSCQRAVSAALSLAQQAGHPAAAVTSVTGDGGVDAALILDGDGTPVGQSLPDGAQAADITSVPDCRSGVGGGPGIVVARVTLQAAQGTVAGSALAAVALAPLGNSPGLLAGLSRDTGVGTTLVAGGRAVAGTVRGSAGDGLATRFSGGAAPSGVVSSHGRFAAALPLVGGASLVLSKAAPGHLTLYLLLALAAVLALALAVLAGAITARIATASLVEMSHAATRVAGGDLDTQLEGRPGTEMGELAAAFNQMTAALQHTIGDLRDSRDELRRGVGRLGHTLSGTHDLDRILSVILDTTMASVRARGGALLLTSSSRDTLFLSVGRGLDGRVDGDPDEWSVHVGGEDHPRGVIARVASTGEVAHGVVGTGGLLLASDEPRARTVLALPLRSAGSVTGVLCLYDRSDGEPFDEADIAMVQDFCGQATGAVDNVLMHREAQRLSITDGLTGLWNYRYATLALLREVERAQRFGHPLAVLMLDLDRFKLVNDRYGHQRGDAVLMEVAARVRAEVREVDIIARYGGEELLLILPETDTHGAHLLAERIRSGIRARPMGGPGEDPIVITASIGLAVYPGHGGNARTLLRAADNALYTAKASGRDAVRVAPRPAEVHDPEVARS